MTIFFSRNYKHSPIKKSYSVERLDLLRAEEIDIKKDLTSQVTTVRMQINSEVTGYRERIRAYVQR